MTVWTLLLIVLLFCLVGAFPRWPHSASWGYWPSALIAVALLAVTVFALSGGMS
jgi:hypothetical protein